MSNFKVSKILHINGRLFSFFLRPINDKLLVNVTYEQKFLVNSYIKRSPHINLKIQLAIWMPITFDYIPSKIVWENPGKHGMTLNSVLMGKSLEGSLLLTAER